MGKFYLASAYGVALLWLCVACGNTDAQTTKASGSRARNSKLVSCQKDSQCPSGQALRVYIRL
jgi:hypothetical protein